MEEDMDFFKAMDISTTGIITQRYRLNVCVENLANVHTTRTPGGGPYRRKQIVIGAAGVYEPFLNVLMGVGDPVHRLNGVRVLDVVEDTTPFKAVHKPGHPDADKNGYVLMPNVNSMIEMADIVSATRAYEANIAAFSAAKSMVAKALELAR
jgi:flagellar basal-body rod protein FlgC